MAQMVDMEGGTNVIEAELNNFDIEMSNLDEDFCLLPSSDLQLKNRSFHAAR